MSTFVVNKRIYIILGLACLHFTVINISKVQIHPKSKKAKIWNSFAEHWYSGDDISETKQNACWYAAYKMKSNPSCVHQYHHCCSSPPNASYNARYYETVKFVWCQDATAGCSWEWATSHQSVAAVIIHHLLSGLA